MRLIIIVVLAFTTGVWFATENPMFARDIGNFAEMAFFWAKAMIRG